MKKILGLCSIGLVLLTAANGHAEIGDANTATAKLGGFGFGKQGQYLLYGATGHGFNITSLGGGGDGTSANIGGTFGDASAFTLSIQPNFGYFITDQFVIGGLFGITYTNTSGESFTTFRIGPSVGVHFAINDKWSALPTLAIAYQLNSVSNQGTSNTDNGVEIDFRGDFLYHLAPHFSAVLGPYLAINAGSGTEVSIGLSLGLLGWL